MSNYTKKDFQSGTEVRWCAGCGDFAILNAVQSVMAETGVPKEKFAVISGIGCSSRFPYYMNTYGYHTIHGRAPAIASGIKIINPDLHVWIFTGDGDAISIGGNHFIHTIRRNLDVNIVLHNNEIYGLTKGQYSPTSRTGTKSKTSPYGSIERPMNPSALAIGSEGTFVARSADMLGKHMQEVLMAAHNHKGTSFVEVLQNCVIFNDGVYKGILGKDVRDDNLLLLEAGKPMIFGKDKDKGIRFNAKMAKLEVVNLSEVSEDEILIHDPSTEEAGIHFLLTQLKAPVAMGVIRAVTAPTYQDNLEAQEKAVTEKLGKGDLIKALSQGETWEVE